MNATRASWITSILITAVAGELAPAQAPFEAGAARVDITPPVGLPMWGYGARKDVPCQGTLDPLTATGVVLRAGDERLAIVGLDLGRSPARETLRKIRAAVKEQTGIERILLVGSHTHHGPCLELEKETLELHRKSAEYIGALAGKLVECIASANKALRPARIAAGHTDVDLNRNRHSKLEPKPVDRRLTVVRLEGTDGKPIALLVNFAAHPTTREAILLKWSADFPAGVRSRVEKDLGGLCVYLQGACGDLSTNRGGLDTLAYGEKLGEEALQVARKLTPVVPGAPSIQWQEEELCFSSRIQLSDPVNYLKYCAAFFKDLVDAYVEEYKDGVRPSLSVALLNGEIGIVGASGELFSSHAMRLRERSRLPELLFLGYTNGYHQYFPTIEAVSEGGYGADPEVSPVEVGAGERMMDRALIHLYDLRKPKK